MPRPGFVLDVDRSTPPMLFWRGENFSLERLPAGRSRVIYPPEPLPGIEDPEGAIRNALLHPMDADPLPTLLKPGMKLTICFDDASLSLPKMRRPDTRQRIIEAVLEMAAEAGVDDVHLIAALGLHRRMHDYELKHVLGDRIFDAFHPRGTLYQHDAEDYDNLTVIGETEEGEVLEINKRVAESDLVVYANVNQVAMDGGWKSITTGVASYRCLSFHHNPKTLQNTRSLMDRHHSALHQSLWRMGEVLRESGPQIFTVETTLNTNTFPKPFDFLAKREWEWNAKDRATYLATQKSLSAMPVKARRKIMHSIESPYEMTSVQAGFTPTVHEETLKHVYAQHLVEVEGQTDILTMGIPYICPYNPEGVMNPILVMCMGLGYLFNMYRGKPLVREGGVIIMTHPTYRDFNPVHHPSYIDFFEEVLTDTTDPAVMSEKWEKKYAEDEWYRHLYRTGNAYHGVHPFYAWYWGAHGQQHAGKVIIVGGDAPTVRRLGFTPASTMNDAFEIASDVVGRAPTITHLHVPSVLVADVK
ncbi:lactate racemase domain-containing protein [uncultured Ilumatobacter sp.]|jgi:lactate racemase|uniref:lactate racemase domain-containing protein n=1 Tax=uncultured Ilumatobacter sp. TaxID=879968 RepID=UPI00374F6D21